MERYANARHEILEQLIAFSSVSSHRGMVGTISREGNLPEYIYGEITGYYLSFCSYVCKRRPTEIQRLSPIMASHVNWLVNSAKSGFITRCPMHAAEDWRNSAIFPFDVSMIIRGVTDASYFVDIGDALALYTDLFCRFFDYSKEALLPYVNITHEKLPVKWSTRNDVHFAKIVANALPAFYRSGKGKEVCILIRMLKQFDNRNLDLLFRTDSHPLFYYLEGMALASSNPLTTIFFPTGYTERIHNIFKRLTKTQKKSVLLDNPTNGSYARSDVLAQFARIGMLLRAKELVDDEGMATIGEVLDYILDYCFCDGKVLFFTKERLENSYNSWCAMFLYQALDYYLIATEPECMNGDYLWRNLF